MAWLFACFWVVCHGRCPGGEFAIPIPFSYVACIKSVEKKGAKDCCLREDSISRPLDPQSSILQMFTPQTRGCNQWCIDRIKRKDFCANHRHGPIAERFRNHKLAPGWHVSLRPVHHPCQSLSERHPSLNEDEATILRALWTIDLYTRTLDSALSIQRTQLRRQNLKGGAHARNRAKLLPGTWRGIGMHGYRCKFITTLVDNKWNLRERSRCKTMCRIRK